jgi:hypothetical protein
LAEGEIGAPIIDENNFISVLATGSIPCPAVSYTQQYFTGYDPFKSLAGAV